MHALNRSLNRSLYRSLLLAWSLVIGHWSFVQPAPAATNAPLSAFRGTNLVHVGDLVPISVNPGTTNEHLYYIPISNLLSFVFGRLDTNNTYGLAGFSITTPWSPYEGTNNGNNMHELVISSLGASQNSTNGGGDGFMRFCANFAGSNCTFLQFANAALFMTPTNSIVNDGFSNKMVVITANLGSTPNAAANVPHVRIGGNTNLPTALFVVREGPRASFGPLLVSGSSVSANSLVSSNNALAGPLFSSTTPTAIAGATAGETNLIGPATIPVMCLTNDQDRIDFHTTIRTALTPASHLVKVYFGSTAIFNTGTFVTSNALLSIHGHIVNQNTSGNGTNQYIWGEAYWSSAGAGATAPPYAFTNWSMTAGETNWLDTRLVVAVTNSVANVTTNECLHVDRAPKGPYTY